MPRVFPRQMSLKMGVEYELINEHHSINIVYDVNVPATFAYSAWPRVCACVHVHAFDTRTITEQRQNVGPHHMKRWQGMSTTLSVLGKVARKTLIKAKRTLTESGISIL